MRRNARPCLTRTRGAKLQETLWAGFGTFPAIDLNSPPSAEKQVEDHDQQDEAEAATAVVAHARSHVVAAAASQQQNDDQDDD